ncbi:lasso peptide biosynthesis PqqD family chaperone [Streptosporangium sp. NPDC051022]|uniref:lasso peptide biosynthesis PqqD family chaperone n=1 Tax=Streptosporangium sp. NPDC051022 TaxID=3155752 RepID=UPI00344236B5
MNFSLAPDVSMADTGQSMILLDERSGRYWQLNATGAVVVRLLLRGDSVQEVVAELGRRHPGAVRRIAADVAELMHSLKQARVVLT